MPTLKKKLTNFSIVIMEIRTQDLEHDPTETQQYLTIEL